MNQVTLPKTEYERFKRQAEAYRTFAAKFFELTIGDSIEELVENFRQTNLYSEEFLADLVTGLRKSSYAKKIYDHQATAR